ncbi:MAG: hypothetical protein DHS20C10_09640 [marine bacterium B5-7]|nr:MAG: hypothetical protein DHS20C10_09640 [marine bacterium B5-7]
MSPHILIVEDNRINQKVLQLMLARLGYDSTVVESGEQALQVTAANTFQLVLMDIGLPGIDGIETTAGIRASLDRDVLPIVALTGHELEHENYESLGFNAWLIKPVSLDVLSRTLASFTTAR